MTHNSAYMGAAVYNYGGSSNGGFYMSGGTVTQNTCLSKKNFDRGAIWLRPGDPSTMFGGGHLLFRESLWYMITVNGEQFILYGEAVTGNVYDTAQALLSKEDIDEETRSKLSQIILDYDNELGIPADGLYPEA